MGSAFGQPWDSTPLTSPVSPSKATTIRATQTTTERKTHALTTSEDAPSLTPPTSPPVLSRAATIALLNRGLSALEVRDEEGYTKLMLAARDGNIESISRLLQQGANIDASDPIFGTALMVAAIEGQQEAARVLVEKKADLEFTSETYGYTPLLAACQNGHASVIELLLKSKANPNAVTLRGFTCVMMVGMAEPPIPETLSLLLQYGAPVNAVNEHEMTALMIAARNGRLGTVEILLAAGADVKAKDSDGTTAIKLATCPRVLAALYRAASQRKQGRGIHARYECHESLGEGAFGTVRKAFRLADRQPVAIKIIRNEKLSEEDVATIDNEVAIMEKLNQGNCVRLLEVVQTPKKQYLVMELCQGDFHEKLIKEGPMQERDAAFVIEGVAKAIQHLHSLGVAHRDLKLSNVMVGMDGTPKLADFGMSKFHQGMLMRTSCGTSTYAAPEVLATSGYGPAADLWSLGVMLYMLLSGFPPFHHDNVPTLYSIIKKGEFSFGASQWAGISDSAKDLIRALLVLDPLRRATAEHVLSHPWLLQKDPDIIFHLISSVYLKSAARRLPNHFATRLGDHARRVEASSTTRRGG